jgi:hypothetical protein
VRTSPQVFVKVSSPAKGVPARFASVGPAAAAKAWSEGWRLCLHPNNTLKCIVHILVLLNRLFKVFK